MIKFFSAMVLLALSLMITGCAFTKSLTPVERVSVKTVSINPKVTMPNWVYFLSQGQALAGGLGGAVGGAIGAANESDNQKEFTAILGRSGLDMPKELAAAFESKLKQKGVVVSEKPAEDQFELQVRMIGLAVPNGFYSSLRPVLVVVVILKDSSGKVLFQNNASCLNLSSKTKRHTLAEYREKPEVLATEYRSAINAVTDELIEDYMAGAQEAAPAHA